MTNYLKYVIPFIFGMIHILSADVKSTSGQIQFDIDNLGNKEATLNSTGLGIGIIPSANLHVAGNAIVDQLIIGDQSSSSNLHISGTIGFGFQIVSSNTLLSGNSTILVDTALAGGNISLSLPNPDGLSGRIYQIKRITTDYQVTISSNTLIDSYSSISMDSTSAESMGVISDGNQWFITDSYQVTGNSLSGLGNLLFWIDASSSPITLVNGNVSQINDMSGNDNHVNQATTTSQPQYIQDALKGKPLLRFDGDDFLTATSLFSGNVFSVFGVMKSGTISGVEDMWISTRVSANKGFELVTTSTGESRSRQFNSSGQYFISTSGAPSSITNYNIHTALFKLDGNELFVNGAYQQSSANGIDETTSLLSIGKVIGASGAGQFDGDIAEIIIFNKTVSDEEQSLIENYLKSKWAY